MTLLNGDHSGILWHSMFDGFSGSAVCLSYCQKPTGWIDRMCHLNATFTEDECCSGWKQIPLVLFSIFKLGLWLTWTLPGHDRSDGTNQVDIDIQISMQVLLQGCSRHDSTVALNVQKDLRFINSTWATHYNNNNNYHFKSFFQKERKEGRSYILPKCIWPPINSLGRNNLCRKICFFPLFVFLPWFK